MATASAGLGSVDRGVVAVRPDQVVIATCYAADVPGEVGDDREKLAITFSGSARLARLAAEVNL